MAKTVEVPHSAAVAILKDVGVSDAASLTDKKLLSNLKKLDDLTDEDTAIDEEYTKLAKKILKNPDDIVIVADPEDEDDEEEEEEEKPKKGKKSKAAKNGKAGGKKGKGKKAAKAEEEEDDEEEEEEEEEDDEDEDEAPKSKGKGKKKVAKGSKTEKASSKKKGAKKKGGSNGAVGRARSTIFDKSVTSVLKWMGSKGMTVEQGRLVVKKLAKGDEPADSTIATSIADGRSEKYSKGKATLSKDEAKKIKEVAAKAAKD